VRLSLSLSLSVYLYIYIYICVCVCVCVAIIPFSPYMKLISMFVERFFGAIRFVMYARLPIIEDINVAVLKPLLCIVFQKSVIRNNR